MHMTRNDWTRLQEQADQIAVEIAHHKIGKLPLELHYRTTVTDYYANGKIYGENRFLTPITKMSWLFAEADKYHWDIKYDEKEKTFTFKRTYTNGMYRIATYIPYDKNAFNIVVSDNENQNVHTFAIKMEEN